MKQVRLIIPLPAGGGFDLLGRQVAEKFRARTGQSMIVENRPGGNMAIAAQACSTAAADGTTICFLTQNAIVLNPLMNSKLPYDPYKDLAPVMAIGFQQQVLVAGKDVPAKTFAEFMAFSGTDSGRINYGSIGVGSDSHLITEWLKNARQVKWVHVPFNGQTPMVQAFASGYLHVGLLTAGAIIGQIQAGELKPLLSRTAKRSPLFPDVLTFEEAGLPPLNATSFLGIFAPAAIPKETLTAVRDHLAAILREAEFEQKVVVPLVEPSRLDLEAFGAFLAKQKTEWEPLIKGAGIVAQ